MSKAVSEVQEGLVKLFRDVYFRTGSPLSYGDELRLRTTIEKLMQGIRDEVIAELEARIPKPPPPPAGGDPFPAKMAAPAPKVEEPVKRGFFGNIIKSQVVENPHKKK